VFASFCTLFLSIVDASDTVLFVLAGSLVPKLVGEKKTQNDGIESMSASVFFVLYPRLANFIISVLKDVNLCFNSSDSEHCISQALPSPIVSEVTKGSDGCQTVDVTDTQSEVRNAVPVDTSSLLFPILSLLCRLSPGLEVTGEGKK